MTCSAKKATKEGKIKNSDMHGKGIIASVLASLAASAGGKVMEAGQEIGLGKHRCCCHQAYIRMYWVSNKKFPLDVTTVMSIA